jgi:hypothetical protein
MDISDISDNISDISIDEEARPKIPGKKRAPAFKRQSSNFVESQKGKKKRCKDGFYFVFDKEKKSGKGFYWKCERFCRPKRERCHGRLIEDSDGTLRLGLQPHNHEPNKHKKEVYDLVSTVKSKCHTLQSTRQIGAERGVLSEEALAQAPKEPALRKILFRNL